MCIELSLLGLTELLLCELRRKCRSYGQKPLEGGLFITYAGCWLPFSRVKGSRLQEALQHSWPLSPQEQACSQ